MARNPKNPKQKLPQNLSDDDWPVKAYRNQNFIMSREGRALRILSEFIEPEARFEQEMVSDTVVFFGSARISPRDVAQQELDSATKHGGDIERAKTNLDMSVYYEDARELSMRLTRWSKELKGKSRRFVVCTGGGPGIMEAANRGASEAKGLSIGLNISLPHEQSGNPYISRELAFKFHYFFMRKFWFAYLAKAIIVFPGGFGTIDEFFELMTLISTRKMGKKLPIVLYGSEYWNSIMNLDAMVKFGTISPADLDLFYRADSVDAAFDYITSVLAEHHIKEPGGAL
ncbi:MAG: LOG family protein [Rhodospirillaceae bacterium]|nr:LOG family protein [Rhodospirillaceae bacterium]